MIKEILIKEVSKGHSTQNNSEADSNNWVPLLKYKKDYEAAIKEVRVNEWMRANGKLNAKITFDESVVLADKISHEKEAYAKEALIKEAVAKKAALENELNKPKAPDR